MRARSGWWCGSGVVAGGRSGIRPHSPCNLGRELSHERALTPVMRGSAYVSTSRLHELRARGASSPLRPYGFKLLLHRPRSFQASALQAPLIIPLTPPHPKKCRTRRLPLISFKVQSEDFILPLSSVYAVYAISSLDTDDPSGSSVPSGPRDRTGSCRLTLRPFSSQEGTGTHHAHIHVHHTRNNAHLHALLEFAVTRSSPCPLAASSSVTADPHRVCVLLRDFWPLLTRPQKEAVGVRQR